MNKKMVVALGMALSVSAGSLMAQDNAVSCADLNWAANVLAKYPAIADSCQAVYQKNGELYAKATVEVVRVRGNYMTFRALHNDGTKGDSRSVQLNNAWRAQIGGRNYRASDLVRGQQLNVYIPQDRFALAVVDADGPDADDMVIIQEAVVEMPKTASPLFLIGAAGGTLLALGGILSGIRRRLA